MEKDMFHTILMCLDFKSLSFKIIGVYSCTPPAKYYGQFGQNYGGWIMLNQPCYRTSGFQD